MKRLIRFKLVDNNYVLEENSETIFTINSMDLKFISIDFYKGLYENKYPIISLEYDIEDDIHKKGKYIFSWLTDIIDSINEEFPDELAKCNADDKEIHTEIKTIKLFDYAACAGDGFYLDEDSSYTLIDTNILDAEYAVKISGQSMEPTINDDAVVFVKKTEELENNSIGLFIVDGNVMCKRLTKRGKGVFLVPDNTTGEYKEINLKKVDSYKILGEVIV